MVRNVLTLTLTLVLSMNISLADSGQSPDQDAFMTQIVKQLQSTDANARRSAELAIFREGPKLVPALRARKNENKCFEEVVQMHDRLVAELKGELKTAVVVKGAKQAIDFFSSKGAVKFLLLGLDSELLDVQLLTAQAITQLDSSVINENRDFLISECERFLSTRSNIVQGGEPAIIQNSAVSAITQFVKSIRRSKER